MERAEATGVTPERDRRALRASERVVKRRRRFSVEAKQATLRAAGKPGATVAEVSRQYGVGRSFLLLPQLCKGRVSMFGSAVRHSRSTPPRKGEEEMAADVVPLDRVRRQRRAAEKPRFDGHRSQDADERRDLLAQQLALLREVEACAEALRAGMSGSAVLSAEAKALCAGLGALLRAATMMRTSLACQGKGRSADASTIRSATMSGSEPKGWSESIKPLPEQFGTQRMSEQMIAKSRDRVWSSRRLLHETDRIAGLRPRQA